MKKKEVKRSSALSFTGVLLLILAAVLVGVYFATTDETIQQWYAMYEDLLLKLDLAILSIGDFWIIVFVIFALYVLRCFVPVITVPALCVLSGMVYPTAEALFVNVIGCVIMLTVKYKFGEHFGGGNAYRLLQKNSVSTMLIEQQGTGNPWVLFAFRFIPGFPINPVSQIYGAMGFDYWKYLIISMWGFLPKLFSYTFIGVYVFDPLSFRFFLPFIILFTVSGASILILNAVLNKLEKKS
ncbi:MAG: TVP38/TMEM64 family protein [Clostridia bacterium]|nr:TVP38/TMEM64 family protein [Clostridia bacterium]